MAKKNGEGQRIQKRRCEVEWSTELLVHILGYAMENTSPAPVASRLWPVRKIPAGVTEVSDVTSANGDALAVSSELSQVYGVWAEGDEDTLPSMLCLKSLSMDKQIIPRKSNAAYWLQRCGERVLVCSISQSKVKALAASTGTAIQDRQTAVHVDVIGLDYGLEGRPFAFIPLGATINRAIRSHFTKRVIVYHRIPVLLPAPTSPSGHDAFWIGEPCNHSQGAGKYIRDDDNDDDDNDGNTNQKLSPQF